MSFYTSLSGLKGAQTDLSVVSNNVANAGTVGFKKSGAEFADVFAASPFQSGSIAGQGTRLQAISQEFGQGGFKTSDNALDLAVSGQGFFVTRGAGGGPVEFTRNGNFSLDAQRNVTDSSGNLVQVLPVNAQGAVTATGLGATTGLTVPASSGTARATSAINLAVTFPSDADLPAARAAYTSAHPYAFDRFDPESYNQATTTTVYDAAGTALPATLYYTRTAAPSAGSSTSTWEARLFVGNTEVKPADGSAATTLTFDANGTLTAPQGKTAFAAAQPAGAAAALTLAIDFGAQTKQSAAPFTLAAATQDGIAPGQLDNVTVDKTGLVTAAYSNGDTKALGKVALATFANPAGLRQVGDTRWTLTGKSGAAIVGEAGSAGLGDVESGQLEQSNVDITDELVALIQAQRNFQANAKAIDTENQITQIAVNIQH